MADLYETQRALTELAANQQYGFGVHSALQVRTGMSGLDVGEMPFDPARHSVSSINPLSLMEMATDIPHVRQVIPRNPLHATIVLHETEGVDDSQLAKVKRDLAFGLGDAITVALPSMTDRTFNYIIGNQHESINELGAEYIETDARPEAAAKNMAELCKHGLGFIISDFHNLPVASSDAATVAIKVNHPLELALPGGVGTISLGGNYQVNTNKSRELNRVNDALKAQHDRIVGHLRAMGLTVASVVLDQNARGAFEFDAADDAIANAIDDISSKA